MSKGSKPRNCFSKKYKDNYDKIKWRKEKQSPGDDIYRSVETSLSGCGCPDDQSNNNQKDCCAD